MNSSLQAGAVSSRPANTYENTPVSPSLLPVGANIVSGSSVYGNKCRVIRLGMLS